MRGLRALTGAGLAWAILGVALSQIAQLASIAVLARMLTPHDFGVYAGTLVVVGLVSLLGDLGMTPALVQRETLTPTHSATASLFAIVLTLTLGGGLFLFADVFASLLQMPEIASGLRVLCWGIPLRGLSVTSEAMLQRDMQFAISTKLSLVSYLIGFSGVGIMLGYLDYGVWSLYIAWLCQTALLTGFFIARGGWHLNVYPRLAALRELAGVGSGMSSTTLVAWAANQGANIVVARGLGSTAMGLYSKADQLMIAPSQLMGTALARVLFPAFSRIQGQPEVLRTWIVGGLRIVVVASSVVAGASAVFSEELVFVALGGGWEPVASLFSILAVSIVFRVAYRIVDAGAKALGLVRERLYRTIGHCAVLFALSYGGLSFGLRGVAAGAVAAMIVNFALVSALIAPHIRMRVFALWGAVGASALPGVGIAFICWWARAALAHVTDSPWAAVPTAVIAPLLLSLLLMRFGVLRIFLGDSGCWVVDKVLPPRVSTVILGAGWGKASL